MVLGRRHWIIVTLALILVVVLTACERPLGSNESETAEQVAEATAVAETAEGGDSAAITAEDEASDAAAESSDATAESSDAAESTDPDAGGGTPETSAEDATEAGADAAEASTGHDASEEVASDDAAADTDAAAGEEAASDEAAAEATESGAAAESDEGSTTDAQTPAAMSPVLPATHTVAAGENLYRIGLKYGLSWVTLAFYNGLPNANYIRVGQVLQIPGGGTPSPVPPPTIPDESGHIDYLVQRGDTLNKIGGKFGVSWVEIAEANGLVNPNLIYAGQVLKIPTTEPEVPPAVTHTVKQGETLYRISLQYGVHWLAIAQTNNIAPPYVIYPGQVLTISGG